MSKNNSSPVRSNDGSQRSSLLRSPMERKDTLRCLITKTAAFQEVDTETVQSLEEMINETDNLNLEASIDEQVACQDEILMDSEMMTASSKVLKSATATLTKELSPYDAQSFVEKLLSYVGTLPDTTIPKPTWSLLGDEISKMFRRTPNYSTLSGCLDPLEKTAVVKHERAKREAVAATSRPTAIVRLDKDDDSVEDTVHKIKLLISERYKETNTPIDYFRLILHPQNFGKTIENMLHVSFLTRDGILKMIMDEDGNPCLVPSAKEAKALAKKAEKPPNVQNVLSLNMQRWRNLVKAKKIQHPMINFKENSRD